MNIQNAEAKLKSMKICLRNNKNNSAQLHAVIRRRDESIRLLSNAKRTTDQLLNLFQLKRRNYSNPTETVSMDAPLHCIKYHEHISIERMPLHQLITMSTKKGRKEVRVDNEAASSIAPPKPIIADTPSYSSLKSTSSSSSSSEWQMTGGIND